MTSAEAQRRLAQYGSNEIPERRPAPALGFLAKFWGPIPWMLEATILIQILLDKGSEAAIGAFSAAVALGARSWFIERALRQPKPPLAAASPFEERMARCGHFL